jgi:hypothetical protein
LGGGSELRLTVLVKQDGIVEAALQVLTMAAGLFDLLVEAGDFLAVCGCVELVAEGVGVPVDGLAAQAVLAGEVGDGAVASEEGGGGAGDALAKG